MTTQQRIACELGQIEPWRCNLAHARDFVLTDPRALVALLVVLVILVAYIVTGPTTDNEA